MLVRDGFRKTGPISVTSYRAIAADPRFFFHVITAYDILRHAGVDIAKKDFLGTGR